jgi:hypothetical protein
LYRQNLMTEPVPQISVNLITWKEGSIYFNQEREYCKMYKITKITMGSTCNQNGPNKNSQKINVKGIMSIRTSRKTKTEVDRPSGRGSKGDESEKLEREV